MYELSLVTSRSWYYIKRTDVRPKVKVITSSLSVSLRIYISFPSETVVGISERGVVGIKRGIARISLTSGGLSIVAASSSAKIDRMISNCKNTRLAIAMLLRRTKDTHDTVIFRIGNISSLR